MANKTSVILVNGKPMTNEQYLALLKQASEAKEAYKNTPEYQAEVEARRKMSEKRNEYISKFIDFGKKLGLNETEIGHIGDKLYQLSRKAKQDKE